MPSSITLKENSVYILANTWAKAKKVKNLNLSLKIERNCQTNLSRNCPFKGTVPRDFQGFFHESVSPKPQNIPKEPFWVFSKICRGIRSPRCTTSGKWKKSSMRKVLNIFFGHFWVVELTYGYIFFFKFTLRPEQFDIVPIIWHRWQIYRWCRRYQWWTLTCEYLREFSK
jgi:hypothetical protein